MASSSRESESTRASAGGNDAALENARAQVQNTISTMNQNMQDMAQRDLQLNNLGQKTENFADTSNAFAAQSKQLAIKMKMRQ